MLKNNVGIQFIVATLLLTLVSVSSVWSDASDYDSDKIKPFVSIGLDYRFIDVEDINNMISNDLGTFIDGEEISGLARDPNSSRYGNFLDQDYSGNLAFGIQYDQMVISFQGFLVPKQVVARPSGLTSDSLFFNETTKDTTYTWGKGLRYNDIDLSIYGGDFRFGYQVFPQESFINIIPTLGYGLTFVDVTFPANYQYIPGVGQDVTEFPSLEVENRPYTSIAHSLTAELEGRLKIAGPLHLSGYIGYRTVSFDRFRASRSGIQQSNTQGAQGAQGANQEAPIVWMFGPPERSADMYYGGAKLTWLWKSNLEKHKVK